MHYYGAELLDILEGLKCLSSFIDDDDFNNATGMIS